MSYTILIVEDDLKNRKLAHDLCQTMGYEVIEAENGQEGVTAAAQHHPDLILMDVQMPVMNGIDATRQIKTDPGTKDIPVVVLTAHTMVGDEDEVRASGCDDYMSKPLDTRRLRALLKVYLPGE